MNIRMGRVGDAYSEEMRGFVASIMEHRAPSVTGADAHRATTIGMAATLLFDEVRPIKLREVE